MDLKRFPIFQLFTASSISDLSVTTNPSSANINVSQFPDPSDRQKDEVSIINFKKNLQDSKINWSMEYYLVGWEQKHGQSG